MESQPQNPEFRNTPESFHPRLKEDNSPVLDIREPYLPVY